MAVNCSQCGAEKKQTNHWWLCWIERQTRLCIAPFDFDPAMQREPTVKKICGEFCLHQVVDKFAEYLRTI